MKKGALFLTFLCLQMSILVAQNPISPPGVYLADPSAHSWNGKLYIYGSVDESCKYYCSTTHHLLSTKDMLNWELQRNIFSSKGEDDRVPYSDKALYAPDAAFHQGKYYLYYCMPDREFTEGVAVSDNPGGPFSIGKNLDLGETARNQIDPAVFIDDDGQAYYVWGQFSMKMAKLNPDMQSLDLSSFKEDVLTESEHHFHEGAYLTKNEDTYYLVYADISRADKPTCIGYATSKNVFGPYTYGGVIVDNRHCNPNNWNNHGSIAQLDGKWYVFYHRSTHACNKMRKACVEPITISPDGSIPEVEMTSQGAGPALPATEIIQAEWACLLLGDHFISLEDTVTEKLSMSGNDDRSAYKYIDFSQPVTSVTIRVKVLKEGSGINFRLDQVWHEKIVSVSAGDKVDPDNWQEITVDLDLQPTGERAIWLKFWGEPGSLELDWFRFN